METPKKPNIFGLRKQDLQEILMGEGVPESKARYHSRQIFHWIYQRHVEDINLMTDLSKVVRQALADKISFESPLKESLKQVSSDGTRKFLFKLHDGHTVESVLIPSMGAEPDPDFDLDATPAVDEFGNPHANPKRLTICISSQVGCAMGCKFCFTASMGLIRNLEVAEIVSQVNELSKIADISNIVYMGMGEPLHNLENVARSLEILLEQDGLNFSKRKVTVSTSGLVPAIRKFNERMSREYRANLAISLNGSFNEQREAVMPVNKAFPIETLLDACRDYTLEPHRRITFEYVMMGEHNDSLEDAMRVYHLLKGIPSKVNLIPFNPHPASAYKRPSEKAVGSFQKFLLDRGVATMIRHSRGRDILAACGQLKSSEDSKKSISKPDSIPLQ